MVCPPDEALAGALAAGGELSASIVQHLADCEDCRCVATALVRQEANPPRVLGEGVVIHERYEIVRFVARGGMGEVYEARDKWLDERVALKTIRHSAGVEGARLRQRFKTEVQLARRVHHPNVCRLLESGVFMEAGTETPFLTMEFLEGHPLSTFLDLRETLTIGELLDLVSQVVEAMTEIHRQGILHRDLKPDNVFVVRSRDPAPVRIKLMDFGLARAIDRTTFAAETLGNMAGTPAFFAPEVLWGEAPSRRSDVYSFGVLLHEILRRSDLHGKQARRLERLAKSCAAHDPEQRPPSFTAIARELAVVREPTGSRRWALPLSIAVAVSSGAAALLAMQPSRTAAPKVGVPQTQPSTSTSTSQPPLAADAGRVGEVPPAPATESPSSKSPSVPRRRRERRRSEALLQPRQNEHFDSRHEPGARHDVFNPYDN